MEFVYKIKPNNIRIEEECKLKTYDLKYVFLSKNLYDIIPDKKSYNIFIEFYSYDINGKKKIDHDWFIKSDKITPLNFNHNTSSQYDNNRYINKAALPHWDISKLYDVILGKWIENPSYTHSDAYIVFQTKKELAKFKLLLKPEFFS